MLEYMLKTCRFTPPVMNFTYFVFFISVIQASDEWKLVFKAVTGGNGMVHDLYIGNTTGNIDNLQAQDISQPTNEHFKSDIINHWSEASIVQVRLAVYKSGSEVAYFLFDGIGSNKMNWFSKERLIDSSYSDLKDSSSTTPVNYFSIDGFEGISSLRRRFYINSAWGGCPSDTGWLMVVDTDSLHGCPWELTYFPDRPAILFSPLSTKCQFSTVDDKNLTCSEPPPIQLNAKEYCYKPCSSDESTETTTSDSETTPHDVTEAQTSLKTTEITTHPIQTTIDTSTSESITESELPTTNIESTNKEVSSAEINERITVLRDKLTIHKKNTTSYKRSLTSIYENRTSAKAMGFVGVSVICSVFGLLIAFDCNRFTAIRKIYQDDE